MLIGRAEAFLDQLHKKAGHALSLPREAPNSEHLQVDVMRSRAVRRVQWRLENGPLLYQTFSKDQAGR